MYVACIWLANNAIEKDFACVITKEIIDFLIAHDLKSMAVTFPDTTDWFMGWGLVFNVLICCLRRKFVIIDCVQEDHVQSRFP